MQELLSKKRKYLETNIAYYQVFVDSLNEMSIWLDNFNIDFLKRQNTTQSNISSLSSTDNILIENNVSKHLSNIFQKQDIF